ncbi:unnamed protein product [Ixodes hexagonus]
MRANLTQFLSEHPAEEREDIERSLPPFKTVKSMYYRRMRRSGRRRAPCAELTRAASSAKPHAALEEHTSETSNTLKLDDRVLSSWCSGMPVGEFFWKQTSRGNPLLVVKGDGGSAREYVYSCKYDKPGVPAVKYYVCLGCRKEKEKNALLSGSLPRMKVAGDGRVFDMRNTPHHCSGLTMAQVVGKHFERDHRLSLANCGAQRARDAYEVMRANLTQFLSEHPAEEREDIERSLPPFKSVKSMYHRRMRGSGIRWAPYPEPIRPASSAHIALEEHSSEASSTLRLDSRVNQTLHCAGAEEETVEGHDAGGPEVPDLSSAYPSSPEYPQQAAALDPPWHTEPCDDPASASVRSAAGAEGPHNPEERQKAPNGMPVREFSWKQTLRGNPLLVVTDGNDCAREYTYSCKYDKPGMPVVKYYVCLGCRKEKEKNALVSGSLPRMKVAQDGGEVFDMRNAPHLCLPLTTAQLAEKHLERGLRLSLPNSGARRPKEAYEAVRAKLAKEMSTRPEGDKQDIERHLPTFK